MSACSRMNARRLIAWISSEIVSAASRRGPMLAVQHVADLRGCLPAASASTCIER